MTLISPVFQGPAPSLIQFEELESAIANMEFNDNVADQLIQLKKWLKDRLCNGDPALGRKGAVCPFSKRSMRQRLFWISPYMKQSTTAVEVFNYMMKMRGLFIQHRADNSHEVFRTYVVAFPFITLTDTAELIDQTHAQLKPFFMNSGLMIGQFHDNCNIGGVHNPNFMALHSPIPLFVIRNIVLNDYLLLKEDAKYLKIYDDFIAKNYPLDYGEYHSKIIDYL